MDRIRKGKDIGVRWQVLTNGEPISLEGRDLTLLVKSPIGTFEHDFEVENNFISFTLYAGEQKALGVYSITLFENYGKEAQTAVDLCNAFALVSTTCQENNECGCENLQLETLELGTSNIDVGVRGLRGEPGFSPIIEEVVEDDNDYRLRITTADGVIITPNLFGGGAGYEYEPIPNEKIDELFK